MQKGLVSFITVFLLVVSVVLGILLISAKRELLRAGKTAPVSSQAEKKEVKLPAPRSYANPIPLPKPTLKGTMSVEEAIVSRRSRRSFLDKPLSLAQVSQILWSAQGVTDPSGKRAAPSAREAYPYTVYVMIRSVTGLVPGFYEYLPKEHALGDMKFPSAPSIFDAAGVEETAKGSPIVVILTAAFDKNLDKFPNGTTSSYYLEGGHIGQNLYLQIESLKLGMVVQGGVGKVAEAFKIDPAEKTVYVIPMGYPAPVPSPTPAAKK